MMLNSLIDSHCHLDNPLFDADRSQVLARASHAGIKACVLPATHAAAWQRLRQITVAHAGLYPLYGLHPVFLADHSEADIASLRTWLESSNDAVGIGECGLDQHSHNADDDKLALQVHYFSAQLEIARDTRLPIVVHARGAVEQVIDCIRATHHNLGMVHSYNGSYQQAKRLIDLGFMLGFGGAMTYTRAKKLRRLVAQLPLDALLLETDSPDQPGAQHTGQRNEPACLREVFNVMCSLRAESPQEIAQTTYENTVRLFRLSGNLLADTKD